MQYLVKIKTQTAVAMKTMMEMMAMMVTAALLLLRHRENAIRGSALGSAHTADQTPLREGALSAVVMDGCHGQRAWQQPRCALTCAVSALTHTDGALAPRPALGADGGDAACGVATAVDDGHTTTCAGHANVSSSTGMLATVRMMMMRTMMMTGREVEATAKQEEHMDSLQMERQGQVLNQQPMHNDSSRPRP